jgi:GNAT superfamily N-acetyltransferase
MSVSIASICALHSERPIPAHAVRHLYDLEGWWPQRSLDDLAFVLDQDYAAGAWRGEQLIGFARAVSDGRLRAYIEDVIVHPDHRQQGAGEQLLDCLLSQLNHVETISLFCAAELAPWYERQGFQLYRSQHVLHRSKQRE